MDDRMADLNAAQLSQMIRGYWVSQIVGTMAQLEIADHLAHGPLDCDVLADGIGCEPKATSRLLRASADVGLVSALPDGRFGLTPLGELLRSNVLVSMGPARGGGASRRAANGGCARS